MDSGTTTNTTRKGFLKRAGVALAGALALGGVARSKSATTQHAAQVKTPSAMSRIRTAKGAVARKSVDLA
ncbi:MAG: hypothetical protein NWT02_00155 [Opitutales bacterium]|jgi:hypothetical protein|nr:hypothetical protein [Opitutales bacterium]MDP4645162.1 hypothetical protein [Opitutales bacterium]MDP4694720.1 hypothetical protein [Opitutales bacterium]MDP4778449.1 hypothetical protein [Opitutales bacterium]MDP4884485.1 hypothetical protein [Opitutales bacterium]